MEVRLFLCRPTVCGGVVFGRAAGAVCCCSCCSSLQHGGSEQACIGDFMHANNRPQAAWPYLQCSSTRIGKALQRHNSKSRSSTRSSTSLAAATAATVNAAQSLCGAFAVLQPLLVAFASTTSSSNRVVGGGACSSSSCCRSSFRRRRLRTSTPHRGANNIVNTGVGL